MPRCALQRQLQWGQRGAGVLAWQQLLQQRRAWAWAREVAGVQGLPLLLLPLLQI